MESKFSCVSSTSDGSLSVKKGTRAVIKKQAATMATAMRIKQPVATNVAAVVSESSVLAKKKRKPYRKRLPKVVQAEPENSVIITRSESSLLPPLLPRTGSEKQMTTIVKQAPAGAGGVATPMFVIRHSTPIFIQAADAGAPPPAGSQSVSVVEGSSSSAIFIPVDGIKTDEDDAPVRKKRAYTRRTSRTVLNESLDSDVVVMAKRRGRKPKKFLEWNDQDGSLPEMPKPSLPIKYEEISPVISKTEFPSSTEEEDSSRMRRKRRLEVEEDDHQFVCEHCGRTFARPSNLRRHMKDSHSTLLPAAIKPSSLMCDYCGKGFKDKYYLPKHIRTHHKDVTDAEISDVIERVTEMTRVKKPPAPFRCTVCAKTFTFKANLHAHLRKFHLPPDAVQRDPVIRNRTFTCPVCAVTEQRVMILLQHIDRCHPELRVDELQKLTFQNEQDFLAWKIGEETRTQSLFVKRGVRRGTRVLRFYCNRSGTFRSKGERRRRRKESCKIGSTCPAVIIAHLSKVGPAIKVTYAPSHIGHSAPDLKNGTTGSSSTLPRKRHMGGDVQDTGLGGSTSFEESIDKIRDNIPSPEATRLQLLLQRDSENIAKEFKLDNVRCANDAESVHSWITSCQQELGDDKVIQFMKFQGELTDGRLLQDDFMLVLMNRFQADVLQRLASDTESIICLDSIPGPVSSPSDTDFQLTTLTVVDERGDGFPVAFCVSNRIDQSALEVFLEHVKCGMTDGTRMSRVMLMTDDTPAYMNAWTAVIGMPSRHLLSPWYTDAVWRSNLSLIHGGFDPKLAVYKTLRAILLVDCCERYQEMIESFLLELRNDRRTLGFAAFFERDFVSRPHAWVPAFLTMKRTVMVGESQVNGVEVGDASREETVIEEQRVVNIDITHRLLNDIFVQSKQVRRLDLLINALMKLLQFKIFDRMQRFNKDKLSALSADIRARHKISQSLISQPTLREVKDNGDGEWTVLGGKRNYIIRRTEVPHDALLCPLQCTECRVCVHTFSCTCTDYALRSVICKHIHYMVRLYGLGGLPAYDVGEPGDLVAEQPPDEFWQQQGQGDPTDEDAASPLQRCEEYEGREMNGDCGVGGEVTDLDHQCVDLTDSEILLNPDCHGAGARNRNKAISLKPLLAILSRQIDAIQKSDRQDIVVHVHRGLKKFIGSLEVVQKQPIATPLPHVLDPVLPKRNRTKSSSEGEPNPKGRPRTRDPAMMKMSRKKLISPPCVPMPAAAEVVQTASKVLYGSVEENQQHQLRVVSSVPETTGYIRDNNGSLYFEPFYAYYE